MNETSFSYERISTKTRFEKEAKGKFGNGPFLPITRVNPLFRCVIVLVVILFQNRSLYLEVKRVTLQAHQCHLLRLRLHCLSTNRAPEKHTHGNIMTFFYLRVNCMLIISSRWSRLLPLEWHTKKCFLKIIRKSLQCY